MLEWNINSTTVHGGDVNDKDIEKAVTQYTSCHATPTVNTPLYGHDRKKQPSERGAPFKEWCQSHRTCSYVSEQVERPPAIQKVQNEEKIILLAKF